MTGRNEGLIQNATNRAGSIQVVNQYAGGIAGNNSGRIYSCMHAASGNRVLCPAVALQAASLAQRGRRQAGDRYHERQRYSSQRQTGGVTIHNYGSITISRV